MKITEGRRVLEAVLAVGTVLFLGLVLEQAAAFNEAPMLAKLVQEGKLPPVEKRLPPRPVVVKPVEMPGAYGGEWRRAYTGLSDLVGARRVLYDPLVRWSPDYKILPNLAEKWEISEDGRTYTFSLVKGVRWSDEQPFTADDIVFYFEDILLNNELTPAIPQWLSPGDEPVKVSKIDDHTIRFEFAQPYGLFLEQLASPNGLELVTKPKHYLKKFHKKYADPNRLEALVKEKKASSWAKLFQDVSSIRSSTFVDPHMPSLFAWVTKIPAPGKRFVMERNPYYWKVDTAGNQLPYIDRVVHELQAEAQTIVLKAIAGEIDMQGRNLGGMQNAVLLLASVGEGKFKLVPKSSTASVDMLLAPNQNHQDPVMKRIISDPRFRRALSHAVNRDEINKIVYQGKGIPRQAAPLKESPFYSKSYEKAYLEYNPDKAEALLDEMGLKRAELKAEGKPTDKGLLGRLFDWLKGLFESVFGPFGSSEERAPQKVARQDGKRMRPDGKPLQLVLDVMAAMPTWVDTAEIVASNLAHIGIDTEVKSETRELFRQRVQSSVHDVALWPGDGGMECLLEPRWYVPYSTESLHAPLWGLWFQSGGKQGEEPPPEIKEIMKIFTQITASVTEEKKKELFDKINEANEKNLWVIGLVHAPQDYYVVSKKMHNVAKKDFQSWTYPNPGPIHPEQFFFSKE